MIRFLIHWAIATLGLMALPILIDGVTINHWQTALIAALILGLINTFVKPVVNLLTLPLRILSLGLISLLINGAFMLLVTKIVDGFSIDTFFTAVMAAVVYSVINWAASVVLTIGKDKD
jgi:putative membrane protein